MQNAIKLGNISNLITPPCCYQCRKPTLNMKVSELCYYLHFHGIITDFHLKYMLDCSY
jgi:hypothetical protein